MRQVSSEPPLSFSKVLIQRNINKFLIISYTKHTNSSSFPPTETRRKQAKD